MQSTSAYDTIDFLQTPKKYRRRPITQDEIDLLAVRISPMKRIDPQILFLGWRIDLILNVCSSTYAFQ